MSRSYLHVRGAATEYEVADVFRDYWETYRQTHAVTAEQAKVAAALMACRTATLGGQVYECLNCGAVEFAYHSCRNRHCPKCQKFERAQWVEAQKGLLLPIHYFHVVFTTDHAINAWVPANRAVIYNLLFKTASDTLQAFAAREWGAHIGLTMVLHTWGQTMQEHVHVHCIVTGGGLSFDGTRWVRSARGYLFDIIAVSAAFRDAFGAGLLKLAAAGKLVGVTGAEAQSVVATMLAKKWEVFAKPFEQADAVINYLSKYVHQVAISNYRLTHVGEGQVSFTYHDNQDGGKLKTMILSAMEFIRRFLWHVLPTGFVRARHYGLHHSAARKTKLPQARALLGLTPTVPPVHKLVLAEWLVEQLGEALHTCQFCGAFGSMAYRGEVADMTPVWLWFKVWCGWLVNLLPPPVTPAPELA